MTIPIASDSYRLQTDASGLSIGAVLSVIREEEMPVAYYTELECLAVVAAIKHFECYLAGRRFELETDHRALEGMTTSRNCNRRLTRWALFMQYFDFKVRYRPGSSNLNADGLSRQCWIPTHKEKLDKETITALDKKTGESLSEKGDMWQTSHRQSTI